MISTHTDISRYADVIKAEQRLHSDFILAAETSRIGIWEWDLATDELQVNDALLLLLDIPRTNPVLSGSLWTQAFPADCLAHFTQSIRRASRAILPIFACEAKVQRTDERYGWVSLQGPDRAARHARRSAAGHRHAAGYYGTQRGGGLIPPVG